MQSGEIGLTRRSAKAGARLTAWLAVLFAAASLAFFGAAFAQDDAARAAEPGPVSQAPASAATGPQRQGVILSLNGPVTPPDASYLKREIELANANGKDLIVIEIDTPGGLVDSMKTIIKAILASDAPVATYVSPQGARSAQCGSLYNVRRARFRHGSGHQHRLGDAD